MTGLAFSVWWGFYSSTQFVSPYSLPYNEVSPVDYKKREYGTEEDIWEEVGRIIEVNNRTSRTIGQDMYHLVPLFTNPMYIIEDWHLEVINEFNIVQNFNVSLGVLDEVLNDRLNCFSIIQREYNAIKDIEGNKNGK